MSIVRNIMMQSGLSTAIIDAWQNSATTDIYVSGHKLGASQYAIPGYNTDPVQSMSAQTTAFTVIDPAHAVRQKCTITKVTAWIYYQYPPGGQSWKIGVFFWNGSAYECKASQSFTPTGSGVISNSQTFILSPGLEANEGDVIGFYLPLKCGTSTALDFSNRQKPRTFLYAGDKAVVGQSDIFADYAILSKYSDYYMMPITTYTNIRPYVCFIGDSHLGDGAGDTSTVPDGSEWMTDLEQFSIVTRATPGGNPGNHYNSMPYVLSTILPSNFRYQNFGKGGSIFADISGTRLDKALETDSKILYIHCGINDLIYHTPTQSWETILTNLEIIRGKVGSRKVFVDQVFGIINMTVNTATLIDGLNLNLLNYCNQNGWTLVRCHDEMCEYYAGTGKNDKLKTEYCRGDGLHLNTLGIAKWASIVKRYLK